MILFSFWKFMFFEENDEPLRHKGKKEKKFLGY